jgi:excisionase family DNA binding protein
MNEKRESNRRQVARSEKSFRTVPPSVEKLLLKPAEAARAISCSRSKIYELIGSGALPAVRLEGGRLLRVPSAALEKLVADAMRADPLDEASK